MRKALGIFVIIVVAAIVIVSAIATTKPSSFTVARSITIAAPPEKIMPLLDNFHNFAAWSPWQHFDPNMHTEYTGPAQGVGASYYWKGNSKAGEGRMTVLAETPISAHVQLDFMAPFAANDVVDYTLTPLATTSPTGSTQVTWSMSGPMPFMSKVMSVFASMEKMIAPDFERGLAHLKAVAEK